MIADFPALVDTNVLVYRCDPRDPGKQARATEVLRRGAAAGGILLPHQAILEFFAAVTRKKRGGPPLLEEGLALQVTELLMAEFEVLYPTPEIVRTALSGRSKYRIPWYDAHLWAHAEVLGIPTILSEDFTDGWTYGSVQVISPFRDL